MKLVLFFALMLLANITTSAQQIGVQPDDPSFVAKYADLDFNGKFATTIIKDDANNYFLLDFSLLPTRFDRVFFMNLSFSSEEIINIDPVVTRNRVCFMSNQKYSEVDVLKIFDEIKGKVVAISSSWSDDKKAEWLKDNDKYN